MDIENLNSINELDYDLIVDDDLSTNINLSLTEIDESKDFY